MTGLNLSLSASTKLPFVASSNQQHGRDLQFDLEAADNEGGAGVRLGGKKLAPGQQSEDRGQHGPYGRPAILRPLDAGHGVLLTGRKVCN